MSERDLASAPRARGPGARRLLRAARATFRRCAGCARCSPPIAAARPLEPSLPMPARRARSRQRGTRSAPRAPPPDAEAAARRIPGAVRRRRQERGQPLRVALSRTAVGAAARGDPGDPRPTGLARKPESSEFEDHLSVMLETMRLLVSGDGERPPADIAVNATSASGTLLSMGLRLLHCNIGLSYCQLLPARRIIHELLPGART